jgi:hypothetical protein
MTDRIQCVVPFCKRTRKRESFMKGWQWICGEHWKPIPLAARKVYGRRVKKWRRFNTGEQTVARLWRWLAAKACDRAGAIGPCEPPPPPDVPKTRDLQFTQACR